MISTEKGLFYDAFKSSFIVILQFHLRQLYGEELQGLTLKELQKLEGRLDSSLNRLYKAKVHDSLLPSLFSTLHKVIFLLRPFNIEHVVCLSG